MKVLMLSRHFMKAHWRAGDATFFKAKYRTGKKIHTIRENSKGHFKDGERVELREWRGMPYRSKQRKIDVTCINIEPITMLSSGPNISDCIIGGIRVNAATVAENDGLTYADFIDWFFPQGRWGSFHGDILHFTGFTYASSAS